MSTGLVEVCRRSCGGHGFLMSSGIAENACSALALVTVEGENTVLYLQTARYIKLCSLFLWLVLVGLNSLP